MNLATRHHIDLITVLTHKELTVRYKNSVLGFLWSIGHPLAMALVFFVAFKMVMRIQMEEYSLFLIAGLFPWQWFCNAVSASPLTLIGNASLIKKVSFPRAIIPLTLVLHDMIHFFMSLPVIVIFMLVYHKYPALSWIYGIPCLAIIQFILTYGVALALSSVNLFFRDLERLTVIFTNLLFYFTPIFYPETMVPDSLKPFLYANPMALLVSSWRSLFLTGQLPMFPVVLCLGESLLIFTIGYSIYQRLSWKFAEAV
jgi:lipopolysaccharide transport system permease protein